MANKQTLQNEDPTQVQDGAASQTQVDTGEPSAEGAAAGAADDQQLPENVQKVINDKHFQLHEEKRKREAAEAKAQALEQQQAQAQQTLRPEVPAMPDAYDPQFKDKIAARDKAIAEQAAWDAKQAASQQQTQFQQQQAQQAEYDKQQAIITKRDADFTSKAVALGITPEETLKQQSTIAPFLHPDVASFLLEDAEGPLLVKQLSMDIMELDKISRMPPMQAAVYISKVVAPKAGALKKNKISNAPDPATTLGQGAGGATQHQDEMLKGVTFE